MPLALIALFQDTIELPYNLDHHDSPNPYQYIEVPQETVTEEQPLQP